MTITKFRAVMLGLLALALVFGAYLAGGGQAPSFSAPQQRVALAAPAANVPLPPTPTGNEPKLDLSTGDAEMTAKQSAVVPAGAKIKGDVMVWDAAAGKWLKFFDEDADSAKSGAILSLNKDATVYAPLGANVTTSRDVPDLEAELKTSGCEGNTGCATVDKYEWPTGSASPAGLRAADATAYPAPEPTALAAAPTAVTGTCPQKAYKPGQQATVPAGCVVTGDVIIAPGTDKQLATDSVAETGMVTIMGEEAVVIFPSGGSVIDPLGEDAMTVAQRQADVANITGCTGGCEVTRIYEFPSGKVTLVKAGTK